MRLEVSNGVRLLRAVLLAVGLTVALGQGTAAAQGERALELVTPAGLDPDVTLGIGMATPDGDFVCYHSQRSLFGAVTLGVGTSAQMGYCARRGEAGWSNEWTTGPAPAQRPQGVHGSHVYFISDDGRRVAFASDTGIFPDLEQPISNPDVPYGNGVFSAFLREDGVTRWLAPAPNPPVNESGTVFAGSTGGRQPLAVSHDLGYGLFGSGGQLVPQDTNNATDVYRWTPDGVELVSADENGNAVGGFLPLWGTTAAAFAAEQGAMSSDGSRVFFHHTGALVDGAPNDAESVFMRDGDELRLVSPRRGPAGPNEGVRFAGATPDGSTVYLTTTQQLTNEPKEAGIALYRYEVDADELELIATNAAGVDLLGISLDGSTLVYTTRAAVPPVIVLRDGVATTLGTAMRALDDSGSSLFAPGVVSPNPDRSGLRISPDGRVVSFASAGSFAGTVPGVRRVYRWEEGAGIAVVSADQSGAPSTVEATVTNYTIINVATTGDRVNSFLAAVRRNPGQGRVMSDDGRRVFFETAQALVDDDVNGVNDVYEWVDGELRLVSPGTQSQPAFYHDNSADGRTVFFTTEARLIPELDRNASRDLYAARIEGGFPLPERIAPCEGDLCQHASDVPAVSSPATRDYRGAGNSDGAPRSARLALSVRPARLRPGSVTTLRVRVSRPGRIAVAGRLVRGRSRVARRAGVYLVRVRLTRDAAGRLRSRGSVAVGVRVSFRARGGGLRMRRLTLRFRAAAASRSSEAMPRG